ncbi:unnamed protein product [Lota lota]
MLTMRLLLCLLLFWITDAKMVLKEMSGKIMINCDNITENEQFPYTDTSEELTCDGEQIYVRIRTCDNCIEMDIWSTIGLTVGDLMATTLIGLAVYLVASHGKTPALTSDSKSSDRQHLIPSNTRGRGTNAIYQDFRGSICGAFGGDTDRFLTQIDFVVFPWTPERTTPSNVRKAPRFPRRLRTSNLRLVVQGMQVYTASDVEAVNGTDVRLKCTFHSSASINPSSITASWSFRPLGPGSEESVFYYHERPYPPSEGRFRKRAVWAGDIMARDASIIVQEVQFSYNGTFSCRIKNPPDVHGNAGEIRLRVVTTASFSELLLLVLAIGGAIGLVVIFLVVCVSCRRCAKKRARQRHTEVDEEAARKERKDPTVCHPAMAVHLYLSQSSIEMDSSDGMISNDPSSSSEDERSTDEDVGGDSD